jgi:branched-chain amino acid aminotransferase
MSDHQTSGLACLDGEVAPSEQTFIAVTDDGLLRGDGTFEVMRVYDGRPFALDDHLERLELSAGNLRLPVDIDAVRADVRELLSAAEGHDGLLRVVITRGGRRLAMTEPLPDLAAAVRLGYVTYSPTRVLDGVKSLSYAANMLATRLAQERGFDEALFVSPHGRVLEAPTSTLFWVADGELLTPPLEDHILASITRSRLFDECDARELACTPELVESADEAFLASSMREVQPVSAIEDHELSVDGPVTATARRKLSERIAAELSVAR